MAAQAHAAAEPQTAQRFYVHARDEARSHAHFVAGAESLQDAALRFAEHWSGPEGEIRLIAFDGDTGEERCFCIDLDAGEAEPCR